MSVLPWRRLVIPGSGGEERSRQEYGWSGLRDSAEEELRSENRCGYPVGKVSSKAMAASVSTSGFTI